MGREPFDLRERDVEFLARAIGADTEVLRDQLHGRPRQLLELLRHPAVVERVVSDEADEPIAISPLLHFAVVVHRAADELAERDWVGDWVGPRCRLPVFDVEPLVEFADAPGRLRFTTDLLVDFAGTALLPMPADPLDLDDLVAWLDAAEPRDRSLLLRRLGDLALFQAGVFPDASGSTAMSPAQAERLGRSVQMTDDELDDLVDHGSPTAGLDALERLSSAWYRAAAETPQAPVVLCDVANRIRAARRFLNYVADRFLFRVQPGWSVGA